MNYHHLFHAGSFADVFKHCILINLIESLLRKDKGFCYVDTHAGIGIYDLQQEAAQKTREYKTGISKIYSRNLTEIPATIAKYIGIVLSFNQLSSSLRYYPGSPAIVRSLLRSQDRMILSEFHSHDYQSLKQEFKQDKQVAVHHLDGYQGLKAFLPPEPRRGLVLIDPPYEDNQEFERIEQGLKLALKRWETGIYAVWYPIKSQNKSTRFLTQLRHYSAKNILLVELSILPADSPIGLNGSGIVIFNAPWQLELEIEKYLSWLWQALSINNTGSFMIKRFNFEI